MRHRYSYLDPELIRQLLAEMGLRRLFNQLLLQSGGDVDEAMRWMRMLQQHSAGDPDDVFPTLGKEAIFQHFTRERVMSEDAKRDWVEPDLLPLQ